MRILILNWKDVRHPESGGAEFVTHQFAKHLVKKGHEVILISSGVDSLAKEEWIDRVKIIRRGTIYSIHLWAYVLYMRRFRLWPDVVVDQIHGIPFFTPFYVKQPILAYIHEVAGQIWYSEFPYLVAWLGSLVEKHYFKFYRNIEFLTHSQSTKQELAKQYIEGKLITVISPTISSTENISGRKTSDPILVYVGRVSPVKRLELLLLATKLLKTKFENLRVYIVGHGKKNYVNKLYTMAQQLKITNTVTFQGYISEKERDRLLQKSWLHIHPSLKEGFGITVLEAARLGTPTVAFNVNGLRNLIQDGKTGVLVKQESAQSLADAIGKLISQPTLCISMGTRAYFWSNTLPSWDMQAQKLEQLLRHQI